MKENGYRQLFKWRLKFWNILEDIVIRYLKANYEISFTFLKSNSLRQLSGLLRILTYNFCYYNPTTCNFELKLQNDLKSTLLNEMIYCCNFTFFPLSDIFLRLFIPGSWVDPQRAEEGDHQQPESGPPEGDPIRLGGLHLHRAQRRGRRDEQLDQLGCQMWVERNNLILTHFVREKSV